MFNGRLIRRILLLTMFALVVYMGVGFVRQTGINRQRREELHALEARIEEANEELSALKDRFEYVESPEAAEEWARNNGWSKQDEQPVVVVAPPAETGGTGEAPEVDAEPPTTNEVWWDFFFGEP